MRDARAVAASFAVAMSTLAGLPSVGPTALRAQEAGRTDGAASSPLVETVSIEGVRALDPGELRDAIVTRPTECRTLFFQPFCWFTEGGFFQDRHRLDRNELSRDELRVRVFHWLRGYREAEATSLVRPSDGGVEVRFEVAEGPPTVVSSLEVRQDTALLSPSEISRAGWPEAGEPLDMLQLRAAEQQLREELFDMGYANAVVEDSIVAANGGGARTAEARADSTLVDVRVRVRPGRLVTIDGIRVQGHDRVSERTILRSLALERGNVFRARDLEAAQRRLYRSSLFRQSLVTTVEEAPELADALQAAEQEDRAIADAVDPAPPRPDPADTTRTVLVLVQEAPFDDVALGVGVTTLEFVQTQAGYTRHNLFGGARRLDLNVSVGNLLAPTLYDRGPFSDAIPEGVLGDVESAFLDPTWRASIDFTQPWLGSTANSLGLGLFGRRRAVPGVVVEQSFGGTATLSRTLGLGLTAALEYNFERTETTAGGVYFCANFGICASTTIDALQQYHTLSPISLSATARRVDDPMDPTEGFTADLRVGHASAVTASDYRYNSASAEGALFRRLGPGVLAVRLRAGWVRASGGTADALGVEDTGVSILHPRARLYSGGASSVRGYGENQLGPRILTVPVRRLTEPEEEDGSAPCTEEAVAERSCDPGPVPSDAFQPRPLGGNELVEGTVEYRVPVTDDLGIAFFVDAGHVGDFDLNVPTGARTAVTPGAGVRYMSPAGIVRVDLGIRPELVERLPVVTAVGEGEDRRLVRLENRKRYDPVGVEGSSFEELYRRLVLHLSIGGTF